MSPFSKFCLPVLLTLAACLSAMPQAQAAPPHGRFYFGAGNNDYNSVLFESNLDASNTIALTGYQNGRGCNYPSVSADGTRIAFESNQTVAGDGDWHLWVMNADGSQRTQLTFDTADQYDTDQYPVISPDGKKIAFTSNRNPETINIPYNGSYTAHPRELYVINTDGTGLTQLTFSDANQGTNAILQAAWGTDSKTILFSGDVPWTDANGYGSRQGIYTIQSDGSGLAQTLGGFNNFYNLTNALDWSHDGRYILYTTAQSQQNPLVHTYDLQTSTATSFAQPSFSGSQGDIRFSPDGSQIALSRYYQYDLLFTDRSGNALSSVTETNFFKNYSGWNLNGDGFWWQDTVPVTTPKTLSLKAGALHIKTGAIAPVVAVLKDSQAHILAQVDFTGSVTAIGGWSGYSQIPDYDPLFFTLSPYELRVQNNGITSGPYLFTATNGGLTATRTIIWGHTQVQIKLVSTVRYGDGSVRINVEPYEAGDARVANLTFKSVTLNGVNYTYTNRTFYSDMGPGAAGVPGNSVFDFASGVLPAGTTGVFKVKGTYVGGSFTATLNITIP